MYNPKSSKAYRRALSSKNSRARKWLQQMVSDDYVIDIIDFEVPRDSNFGTLWVVSKPGVIHAYSVPLNKSCSASYNGNIEQFFENGTRKLIKGHYVGFWTHRAMWLHQMNCWLKRHDIRIDYNARIIKKAA